MKSVSLLPLFLVLLSCENGTQKPWSVTVSGLPSGTPYYATFTFAGGGSTVLRCPGATVGDLSCTAKEVQLPQFQGTAQLTLKARGFVTAIRALTWEQAVSGRERFTLLPLPPFEVTEDYTTGFAPEGGLEQFLSMAWVSATELGKSHLVKFYIDDLQGTPQVYFMHTLRHPIHFDFVRGILGKTISYHDFLAETYQGSDRKGMAGTIQYYPDLTTSTTWLGDRTRAPFTLTFFPSDNITPDQVLTAHRLLEERLGCSALEGAKDRFAYVPAGMEQTQDAQEATQEFAAQSAPWFAQEELYGAQQQQLLNPGLAYGTLRLVTVEELQSQVFSYKDILLLTRLPNDLPVVGGTITEELQTPLSHVNVAARNRGTPNMALLNASTDDRIAPFLGQMVRFEVTQEGFQLAAATQSEAEAYWETLLGETRYPEADLTQTRLRSFSELQFQDAVSVGAKAANLGELHQLFGENTSVGFGVPFYYYDLFLDTVYVTTQTCSTARESCLNSGRLVQACEEAATLCTGIAPNSLRAYLTQLLSEERFLGESSLREAALAGVRYFFTSTPVDPDFAFSLDRRVAELFGTQRVRLRSSTNAEDLEDFSGAGLYNSYSARASGKKRASLVIRKTWASVWSWSAFEERAYWNIDHLSVMMGVAVNRAFPNETANGVILTQNIANPTVAGMYVNVQLGETSVTNPAGGELPEIFSIIPSPQGGVQVNRLRYSSLSPSTPILTEGEVQQLYTLAQSAHSHFASLYGTNEAAFVLDMEFKIDGTPRKLYLKQARPYIGAR